MQTKMTSPAPGADKHTILKQYFGHSAFRPGQAEMIDALLAGRDVLGVMPTGAGKSMCYQIPALLLPGITLVVSPLISLMKDQVAALTTAGVPVAFINSSLTANQYREVYIRAQAGEYKIIYVAPERLTTEDFLSFAEDTRISMVAVDEAHCVSQWGQDFRPGYLRIVDFIHRLSYRPVVGGFTATATEAVKEDVARILELHNPLSLTTGFDRPNLSFEVMQPKSKPACLRELLRREGSKSGIIYCATRKSVESVCTELKEKGISATQYHAGLGNEERRQNQEDFVYDRVRVMVATNAFGMGIDKSNVSFVFHYNMPKNLESYYQEAGRAGRDGEPADCVLLFSAGDIQTAKFLIQNTSENESLSDEEREILQKRDMERLSAMIGYCKTNGCLRSYILGYFGEHHGGGCGNCGNCKTPYTAVDITVTAQKILSCVARGEKAHPYGLGVLLYVRTLIGSKEQRVIQLGMDRLSTYGILHELSRMQIREYIDWLVTEDYLRLEAGEYPVLRLAPAANEVLFRGKTVMMPMKAQSSAERIEGPKHRRKDANAPVAADEGLYGALKELRTTLAQDANVPAYVIFSNATLTDMANKAPRSMMDFLQVSGVGEVKAERYGKAFLGAIEEYLEG